MDELLRETLSKNNEMEMIFFVNKPIISKWVCNSGSEIIDNTVYINDVIEQKLSPIEYLKKSIDIGNDDFIIRNKLFDFLSNPLISKKYTKKGVSSIMDGLSQNKWNINVCKLFSFLFNVSFIYRKNRIEDSNNISSGREPYSV